MNNKYRIIPQEDCKYKYNEIHYIYPEYPNVAFCECGYTIFFKLRHPKETVIIHCKKCGGKIIYG